MHNHFLFRLVLPVFTLLMSVYGFSLPATAGAFAKFDGIDGESKDRNHQQWIDVLSISESIVRPDAESTGDSRRRGAAVFEDIVIVKELDRSSVTLREKLAQGAVIPKLEIELAATFGDVRGTYFKYELKNVQITSFSLNVSGGDGEVPTESIAVSFEEIKWIYTQFDDRGNRRGKVRATWNIGQGAP